MDYFVVGLGNPGNKYTKTRHNVAWIILAEIFSFAWEDDKYLQAQYLLEQEGSNNVHYLMPTTFMNKSGLSIAGLKKVFSTFTPERLVVIYDDIDLPLGVVRVSFDRGSGGHNGVKSITNHLGSQRFVRVRVGVSKTLEDGRLAKPAVLGTFERAELQQVRSDITLRVQEIISSIVQDGYQQAMNTYNQKI